MRNIDEILNKVKELKGIEKDTDLAKLLGVRQSTLSTWRKRKIIPYEVFFHFCEKERLDLTWLLTGQVVTKTVEIDGKRVLVPSEGEPGFYLRADEPETPEEKRLHAVLIRVKYIYHEGSLEDKARVRGIVEEVYDQLVEKVERTEKTASKKGA